MSHPQAFLPTLLTLVINPILYTIFVHSSYYYLVNSTRYLSNLLNFCLPSLECKFHEKGFFFNFHCCSLAFRAMTDRYSVKMLDEYINENMIAFHQYNAKELHMDNPRVESQLPAHRSIFRNYSGATRGSRLCTPACMPLTEMYW